MSTGPEHYSAAEGDLHMAARAADGGRPEDAEFYLKRAQVQATLALAAATALNDASVGMSGRDHKAWLEAAATARPEGETR